MRIIYFVFFLLAYISFYLEAYIERLLKSIYCMVSDRHISHGPWEVYTARLLISMYFIVTEKHILYGYIETYIPWLHRNVYSILEKHIFRSAWEVFIAWIYIYCMVSVYLESYIVYFHKNRPELNSHIWIFFKITCQTRISTLTCAIENKRSYYSICLKKISNKARMFALLFLHKP